MADKRKSLAKDLGIPIEDASRILIEKEKAIAQSELKYHVRAMCSLLDKMKRTDSDYSEQLMRDSVKYMIARHANVDSLDDICEYIESISENFFEKELAEKFKEGDNNF